FSLYHHLYRYPMVLPLLYYLFLSLCSNVPPTTDIYPLSLHDALPISFVTCLLFFLQLRIADEFKDFEEDSKYRPYRAVPRGTARSEEHTSELQSRVDLVCRLLLEKKKHKER